ncbi:hypothetical protein A2W24_03965 [Microgenomates group bacterium RBG_16_45_19]|nr:MAG: hypothetical protein A2W24_03965 [Microgenomates group bacterium RBG_16_45_19]
MERTLTEATVKQIGQTVTLMGWVNALRTHGGVNFIDLRDRTGVVQVVGGRELKTLHPEDVVAVTGEVVKRDPTAFNPKINTGEVEVKLATFEVLSPAQTLPFPIDTDGRDIDEDLRLKYRYLDIRRPRLTKNLRLRFAVTQFIRHYLAQEGFVEVETPILTKTTPEGARDFIVPSRLQPGLFYALPQSPQQYKQLLMVAGLERYFQIARCFRDEDPRKDRAYGEFTQLDMELSFTDQAEILQLIETMFTQLVKDIFPAKHISPQPWPKLSHGEVIQKYGTDKPDLRQDQSNPDELAFAWIIDFPLFTEQSDTDYFHGSGQAKFAPSHHMFTAPHPDDIPLLDTDPTKVRGLQHDLVLNGFEVGGGSIRIHQRQIQEKVFDLIGFTQEQKAQFEHMLTAFTYGVPPHGGIAPGIDRLLMVLLAEPNLREVIAFPTTASGRTAVVEAPSAATTDQLAELNLEVKSRSYTSPYEHILDLLKTHQIKYQLYEHEPVYTSEDAMKIRGDVSLHQGAKALILQADKDFILLVVPGDCRADLDQLRTFLKAKRLVLASKDSVLKKTGLAVGAIPPFGSTLGLITYVDPRLADNQAIVFNAGRHDRSVKLAYRDFIKLEKPVIITA